MTIKQFYLSKMHNMNLNLKSLFKLFIVLLTIVNYTFLHLGTKICKGKTDTHRCDQSTVLEYYWNMIVHTLRHAEELRNIIIEGMVE